MKLCCVGLNWKTPVKIRERLAFDGEKLTRALAQFRDEKLASEFAILSTCNRTELYAIGEVAGVHTDDLCEAIAHFHEVSLSDFYDHLYFHQDAGAILHLFKVACGLDSLVLGEAQILGQVKTAYTAATDAQTIGATLHALFQKSFAVAKRVQSETGLSKGRLSIASAAVDYIRGVFESFDDKTVLVIGAGKMAELTLTHLSDLKPGRVLVCNRNAERAAELAGKFGGEVRPYADLTQALVDSDIVVSSTGADEPIVSTAQFKEVMKLRRQRWAAVVDIAVPRDFETSIGALDNVMLWNIDDLEKVRHQTLRRRERDLDQALKIVDAEVEAFEAAVAIQQAGPVIGQLEKEYQRITEEEIDWLFRRLGDVPAEQEEAIRHFAHRLKNKFLHPPKTALRNEARNGKPHGLLEALHKLFGLE